AILLDPSRGFLLRRPADLADHDDALRLRIVIEHLDDVEVRRAVHRVATDADAGGLSHTARRELPDGFVGERSAARDHAHVAALVDVARRDADAAAAVRILARPRRDDTRAIRP